MLVISSGSRSGGSGSRNPVVLIVVISHLVGPASMSGDRTVNRPPVSRGLDYNSRAGAGDRPAGADILGHSSGRQSLKGEFAYGASRRPGFHSMQESGCSWSRQELRNRRFSPSGG